MSGNHAEIEVPFAVILVCVIQGALTLVVAGLAIASGD